MTLIRLSKAACYTSPTRVATCGCDCWLIFNFSLEVSLGFVLCNVNSECCSRQEHWPEGTQGREWQVGRVTDRRFQVRDQNQSSQRPYPHVTSWYIVPIATFNCSCWLIPLESFCILLMCPLFHCNACIQEQAATRNSSLFPSTKNI